MNSEKVENSNYKTSDNVKQSETPRNIKFEEDLQKYTVALSVLIKTYGKAIPDFNFTMIDKMLRQTYGRHQKRKSVERILKSFECNVEKVKSDIKLLRKNKDATIKPLMENEELIRIKNAVTGVMSEQTELLKRKNYKCPPASTVREILTKLGYENHEYHFARLKVMYHAYKWMNEYVNPNLNKKVKKKNSKNKQRKEDLNFENYFYVHYTQKKPVDLTVSCDEETLVTLLRPKIEILVQPVGKFQFRCNSVKNKIEETLLGQIDDTNHEEEVPTVMLANYHGNALIRCSLVTSKEEKRMLHAHNLIRMDGNLVFLQDFHEIEVSANNDYKAAFHRMSIIQTPEDQIKRELFRKQKIEAREKLNQVSESERSFSESENLKIEKEADEAAKIMDLNSVALCFQAFVRDSNGILSELSEPVYSKPIENLQLVLTKELKICRTSTFKGCCTGSEEILICVEEVDKNDIKIKFYEVDELNNEIWTDYGLFTERDIHHNYTIGFRTPPYKDTNITSSKTVHFKLVRPSDGASSNSVQFFYEPVERNNNTILAPCSENSLHESMEIVPESQSLTKEVHTIEDYTVMEDFYEMICDNEALNSEDINSIMSDINMDFTDDNEDARDSDLSLSTSETAEKSESNDDLVFVPNILIKILDVMEEKPADEKSRILDILREVNKFGESPLHVALLYNQHENVEALLTILDLYPGFKFLIDVQNCVGKTALHYAVLRNQPELLKSILSMGANPNISDDNGNIPLHVAVTIPEASACIDHLLATNPNLESPNQAGLLPLHLASSAGSLDAVKSLLKAGANVNSLDVFHGRTALHMAIEGAHVTIVEFLLKETNMDVNKRNFLGNTPLTLAMNIDTLESSEIRNLLAQYDANSSELGVKSLPVPEDYSIDVIQIPITKESSEEVEKNKKTLLDDGNEKLDFLELSKADIRRNKMDQFTRTEYEEDGEGEEEFDSFFNEDIEFALKFICSL